MVDIIMENISLYDTLDVWCKRTMLNKRVNDTRKVYQEYLYSTDTKLSDVYDTYSNAKLMAYNDIINEMKEIGGYGFNIISYNTDMFTCGYCVVLNRDKYFIRHTPYYRDCVKVG